MQLLKAFGANTSLKNIGRYFIMFDPLLFKVSVRGFGENMLSLGKVRFFLGGGGGGGGGGGRAGEFYFFAKKVLALPCVSI